MNHVDLIGNVVTDPEIRQLDSGTMLAKFRLAVRRDQKDQNGEYLSDFIQITTFRSVEAIQKYLHKGDKCAVEGRIQSGSYVNSDGVKIYTTEVIADKVEFIHTKSKGQNQNNNSESGAY